MVELISVAREPVAVCEIQSGKQKGFAHTFRKKVCCFQDETQKIRHIKESEQDNMILKSPAEVNCKKYRFAKIFSTAASFAVPNSGLHQTL